MNISGPGNTSIYGAGYSAPAGNSPQGKKINHYTEAVSQVSLSAESLVMNKLGQQIESRGEKIGVSDLRQTLSARMSFDPAVPMAAAEKELKVLMDKAGIPSDPPFSISTKGGQITISPAEHPHKVALEELAGSSDELRNNLVRASSLGHLQAVSRAAYEAYKAADGADPDKVEQIYTRLFQYIDQIDNYDYVLNFKDGELTGGFHDDFGKSVSLPEFRHA